MTLDKQKEKVLYIYLTASDFCFATGKQLPSPSLNEQCAVVYNESKIFVVGGFVTTASRCSVHLDALWEYDLCNFQFFVIRN